jgi:catechol 2,3-dioxygenase-like lactoylglutathione lyase family enzyme
MIKTHGLTHISLAVRDPDRSLAFYQKVFGVKEYYRDEASIQVLGPGSFDVIAFDKDVANAAKKWGNRTLRLPPC